MASPAIHAQRHSDLIDPRQPGDYPIILGESLKGDSGARDSFVDFRYNWQPKSGFPTSSRQSKLLPSDNVGRKFQLRRSGANEDEAYAYTGRTSPLRQNGPSENGTATKSFALVFDESKSAFVLEAISTTLNLNLTSAAGMSKDEVRNFPQLPLSAAGPQSASQLKSNDRSLSSDDETPDHNNPYDFRHFLSEARENIDKSNHATAGNRSPFPGNRTPMSGTSTPVPGGNRFMPTTPQFRSTPVTTATRPAGVEPKKRKGEEKPARAVKPASTKSATSERETASRSSQPLSSATIVDSSDEDDTTISVSRPAPTKATNTTTKSSTVKAQSQSKPTRPSQKHTRNFSANIGSSPHITYDDASGLEIDEGSDHDDRHARRRGRVDPEMFRSHTGTPVGGRSSGLGGGGGLGRVEEKPRRAEGQRERDGDVTMRDIEDDDDDDDDDDDVEDFDLGSPRRRSHPPRIGGDVSRHGDEARNVVVQAPTPPQQSVVEDDMDDDVDDLEAALEAALEEDEESRGVGLGIGLQQSGGESDESEVSEEE